MILRNLFSKPIFKIINKIIIKIKMKNKIVNPKKILLNTPKKINLKINKI